MTPLSTAVVAGDNATADQYNNLRTDAVLGYKEHLDAVDGAVVDFDLSVSNNHTLVLGGNRTLTVSNEHDNQWFTIKLKQDATGSRTVTWFAGISWPANVLPVLTTTANKKDTFIFECTGTNTFDGYIAGQGL